MNDTVFIFCVSCGEDRELRQETRRVEYTVRGEPVSLEVPLLICPTCGMEEVAKDFGDPVEKAFSCYREAHELLHPAEIKKLRRRYHLSQKSFATLLGMSEATVSRYEAGSLQEVTHDLLMRKFEHPAEVESLLKSRGHLIPEKHRNRANEVLQSPPGRHSNIVISMSQDPIYTGFRAFDYERYAAVIVFLCQRGAAITQTKLYKLLFYADFLYYKCNAISLTGSPYRRLPYGPVPADFGKHRSRLELDEYVVVEETNYQNGRTGEEFKLGPKAGDLSVQFSRQETKVLEWISKTFAQVTPTKISDMSHKESAWKDTQEKQLIPYVKAMELSLSLPE